MTVSGYLTVSCIFSCLKFLPLSSTNRIKEGINNKLLLIIFHSWSNYYEKNNYKIIAQLLIISMKLCNIYEIINKIQISHEP